MRKNSGKEHDENTRFMRSVAPIIAASDPQRTIVAKTVQKITVM